MSKRNDMKARRSMAINDSDSELEDESSNVSEDEHGQGEDASSVYLASAGKDGEEAESEIEEVPPKSAKKDDFVPAIRKPLVTPRPQPEIPKRTKK